MRSFTLINHGCKVNQYEGHCLTQMLEDAGLESSRDGGADVVVINTCTVTATAAAKGRKAIRAARRASPGAVIAVTGCMAHHDNEDLSAMDEVNLVVPNDKKGAALALLGIDGPALSQCELSLARPPERTRAFVRVLDGRQPPRSSRFPPPTRGPATSRAVIDITEEARRLAGEGVAEIVLCGIHLGRYGRGLEGAPDLAALIDALLQIDGSFRIRLSSIEIGEVSDGILDIMAGGKRLAPHLHIPMQSGSDTVLSAMNRPYRRAELLEGIGRIRSAACEIGLTTDVIVGFPGETDDDFKDTISALEAMAPHRIHRFPFSAREGTPAASMDGRVPDKVVSRRMDDLGALAGTLLERCALTRIGCRLDVLGEPGSDEGSIEGYSGEYLRVRVEPSPGTSAVGRMMQIVPECFKDGLLTGPERGDRG